MDARRRAYKGTGGARRGAVDGQHGGRTRIHFKRPAPLQPHGWGPAPPDALAGLLAPYPARMTPGPMRAGSTGAGVCCSRGRWTK